MTPQVLRGDTVIVHDNLFKTLLNDSNIVGVTTLASFQRGRLRVLPGDRVRANKRKDHIREA